MLHIAHVKQKSSNKWNSWKFKDVWADCGTKISSLCVKGKVMNLLLWTLENADFSAPHTIYCPVGHLAANWALEVQLGCGKCFQHCLVTYGVVSVVHESLFLFWMTIGRWTSKKTLTMGKQVFDSSTVATVRKYSFSFFSIALPQTSEATDWPVSPQQLTQWIYWIIFGVIPMIF